MNRNLSPIQRNIRRDRWKRRAENAVLPLLDTFLLGVLAFIFFSAPESQRIDALIIVLLVWIVAHPRSERR